MTLKLHTRRLPSVMALLALVVVWGWASEAHAQWSTKWLSVGKFHHPYLSGGGEPESTVAGWHWPGIRPGVEHSRWKGLWVSAENWTDENGDTWDIRTSHIGPRILGIGEFFDISHELVARFEEPLVTVDGFKTFNRPLNVDLVDPDLDPDRIVHSVINTSVGVTLEKRAMQWSDPVHENYHIIEYIFTNTGNTDDDDDIELEGQTLEDVYFTFMDRPTVNAPSGAWDNSAGGVAWGQFTMNDAVAPGLNEDYYGPDFRDFRAQWSWMGAIPGKLDSYNTLGNPMWLNHQWNSVQDDTLGRLGGAQMPGQVVLYASPEAHAPSDNMALYQGQGVDDDLPDDDLSQPGTMTIMENDWSDITTGNDHTNVAKMAYERQYMECGARGAQIDIDPQCEQRTTPTHAQMVANAADPMAYVTQEAYINQTDDPSLGRAGGWSYMNAYGPYDMEPGEQVKIVVAEGVAGLSDDAAFAIGRAYRVSGADNSKLIYWDPSTPDGVVDIYDKSMWISGEYCTPGAPGCVGMTKNEWAMSARDSLFNLFQDAVENYESGYDVAKAPLPPAEFNVVSGTDRISMTWAPFSGDSPAGYELYRAQGAYNGIVTARSVDSEGYAVPDIARAYQCIAGCPGTPALAGGATSYSDSDVARGVSYFYYLQAVDGDGNKSNRYYTQTYEPAFLRRPPGASLSDIRIVPNPYNLSSERSVRFDDDDLGNKLAFYGIPGISTITIWSELGELIQTIEHTDGSGDEFWFMTTSARQLIVSGVYIAVIENKDPDSPEFGESEIRKFVIIR